MPPLEGATINELLDVEVSEEDFNLEQEESRIKVDPKDAQEKITETNPRFKEVYGKMKDYERKNDELNKRLESLESTQEMIDELKNHNKQLANAIEKMSDGKAKDKILDEASLITDKLTLLKQARREARENLEYDTQDKIEDEIDELKDKLNNLKKPSVNAQSSVDETLVEAFNQFVEENDWFTEDPIMQAAAFTVDSLLLKDEKWQKISPSERYAEVKKRVEKRFGYVSDDRSEPKQSSKIKVSSVESGNNRSVSAKSTTVQLTAKEVEVAKYLGLTSEQYAKQKAFGGAR